MNTLAAWYCVAVNLCRVQCFQPGDVKISCQFYSISFHKVIAKVLITYLSAKMKIGVCNV